VGLTRCLGEKFALWAKGGIAQAKVRGLFCASCSLRRGNLA